MNRMVPRTHLGALLCSKPLFVFNHFVIPHFSKENGKAASLFPWWDLYSVRGVPTSLQRPLILYTAIPELAVRSAVEQKPSLHESELRTANFVVRKWKT